MTQPIVNLGPDWWVAQSRSLHFNSGIILHDGRACLIDPGLFPDELDELARFVAGQRAVLDTILLTHWHWDHLLGPERFPGVRVVVHKAYPAEVAQAGDGIAKNVERWANKTNTPRSGAFVVPRPDVLAADGDELNVGSLSLRLIHVPGHSADQLAVYQAETGTLWASDILSDLEIPFVSDNLERYERTLERLTAFELRILIPGHGAWTTDPAEIQSRLDTDRAYLAELHRRVQAAVEAGQSIEEAVAACATMEFRGKPSNEAYHRLNVESAYAELGGDVGGRSVGWRLDD